MLGKEGRLESTNDSVCATAAGCCAADGSAKSASRASAVSAPAAESRCALAAQLCEPRRAVGGRRLSEALGESAYQVLSSSDLYAVSSERESGLSAAEGAVPSLRRKASRPSLRSRSSSPPIASWNAASSASSSELSASGHRMRSAPADETMSVLTAPAVSSRCRSTVAIAVSGISPRDAAVDASSLNQRMRYGRASTTT